MGTTIKQWHTGVKLEDMHPVLTLDDVLPCLKEQELIKSIKNKLKQGYRAGIKRKRLVALRKSLLQTSNNIIISVKLLRPF